MSPNEVQTAIKRQVPPAYSEADVLDRARGGDREAFDEIVRLHRRAVYMAARRLLGSHQDADEAAQVAFVRAWRFLGGFRGASSVRTWLIRIVLNVAKSMKAAPRDVESEDGWDRLPDPGEGSDERLRRDQARRSVRRAVLGLPPRQREVVMLKVFSEMTYREVAAVMELSEGTVKAHLNQAVSNLRRRMTGSGGGE